MWGRALRSYLGPVGETGGCLLQVARTQMVVLAAEPHLRPPRFVAWLEPVASPTATPWSSHIGNVALPTVAPFILTLRVAVMAGEWTDMVESVWLTPLATEVLALKDHRLLV